MLLRALGVWLGILVLAILTGGLRDLVVAPRLGDTTARAISTVLLVLAIVVVTRLTIRWIAPASRSAALGVGLTWLACTLAFELLAGHFLFGVPWASLAADYDVSRGRIWVLVPLATLLAPALLARPGGQGGASIGR